MATEVALRPAAEADLALLQRLTDDPAATGKFEWYGYVDPRGWSRRWQENGLLGVDGGVLMIAVGGRSVGFVGWRKRVTSRTSFCWEVGIAIDPDGRGRGYGTVAQRHIAEYLFRHTQVNRVEAVTDEQNIAEQRSLEKAGFSREGVHRGSEFYCGRWRDTVIYSILRAEVEVGRE